MKERLFEPATFANGDSADLYVWTFFFIIIDLPTRALFFAFCVFGDLSKRARAQEEKPFLLIVSKRLIATNC